MQPCGTVTDFSHISATVPAPIPRMTRENMAEGARFELADPLRGLQFSRLARSAAPSPLRAEESSDVIGQTSSVREEIFHYRTRT